MSHDEITDSTDRKLVHVPKQGLARIRKGGLVARGLELIQIKKTKVRCWGHNEYGECDVPSNLGQVKQITAWSYHSMALLEDGTVRCWGHNDYCQCDVPADFGEVKQIASGPVFYSMALVEGE